MPGPGAVAAIAGGASLLGGALANKRNLKIAREQMAFQERMSDTSYQRAVKDMRIAGINPALAYQQGGASTPGGASATMQDIASPAVSSAQHARRLNADLKLVTAQLKKVEADTYLTDQTATRIASENTFLLGDMGVMGQPTAYQQTLAGKGNPLWRNMEQQQRQLRLTNDLSSQTLLREAMTGFRGDVASAVNMARIKAMQLINRRR